MNKYSFTIAAITGAALAQNEPFRRVPQGNGDYMWHYPNDLRFAFADLSSNFPEHPEFLDDETMKIESDQIPDILDALCRDSRFNGVRLTAHNSYEDDASEDLRRKIVNHARSTQEACDYRHMMVFATTPDHYDMFTDDFEGDEDAYVQFLADYIELYQPEFLSPLAGAQLTPAQVTSIMDKLDTELTTRTYNYMKNNGHRFNPVPEKFRYTEENRRPAWTMDYLTSRRELESSPRDSVRRLQAIPEEPAHEGRRLQTAPLCTLSGDNPYTPKYVNLFAGVENDGATAAQATEGAVAFGWYFVDGDSNPFNHCDGVTGVKIEAANRKQFDDVIEVLYDTTEATGTPNPDLEGQTWVFIEGGANLGIWGQHFSNEAGNTDTKKIERILAITLEYFDPVSNTKVLTDRQNYIWKATSRTFVPEQEYFPNPNGQMTFVESYQTDLLDTLEAKGLTYTIPENETIDLYTKWSDVLTVSPQTRDDTTIAWNTAKLQPVLDSTGANITDLRMLLLLPGSIWYGDYRTDVDNNIGEYGWNSTIVDGVTLDQRSFVLSNADIPSRTYSDQVPAGQYPSSWCTGIGACTAAADATFPRKELAGQPIDVYVTMAIDGLQYIEKVPRSVYAADIPAPPADIQTVNMDNVFNRDASDYTIEWTAPIGANNGGGLPIIGYRVFWWDQGALLTTDNTNYTTDRDDFQPAEGTAFVAAPATQFTLTGDETNYPYGAQIGYQVCTETVRGVLRPEAGQPNDACSTAYFFRTQMPAVSQKPTGEQDGSVAAGWDEAVTFDLPFFTDNTESAGYTNIVAFEVALYSLARDAAFVEANLAEVYRGVIEIDDPSSLQFVQGSNTFSTLQSGTTFANEDTNLTFTFGEQYYLVQSQCNIQRDYLYNSFVDCHQDVDNNTVFSPYSDFFLYADVPEAPTGLTTVSVSVSNGIEMSYTAPTVDNGDDITFYEMRMIETNDLPEDGYSFTTTCNDLVNLRCTIQDTTYTQSVPQDTGTYTLDVRACNTKGCGPWSTPVEDILVESGLEPPIPADDWLVQNQYQLTIAFSDDINALADVAEYQVFWDEGNPDNDEPSEFSPAYKNGNDGSYSLVKADFDANSYVDTDEDPEVTYYYYTVFVQNDNAASRPQAGSTYCFRLKTIDTGGNESEFSNPTCATLNRYRRTQLIGTDFPRIGNGSKNTVETTEEFLLQELVEVADQIDWSLYFDQIGAYSSFGDQTSREENFDYLVNYGSVSRPVFNTMTSGEWYRSTTSRGRWAIDLEATDCNYPEDRRLQSNGNGAQENQLGPGNADKTWRFYDERPMPSATESIDAGVYAISPRLAVPRFVNLQGEATCRTREWLDGGWAQTTDDTYNARSRQTRNHNKCGDGKRIHGLGNDGDLGFLKSANSDNSRGPLCSYTRYNEVAGSTSAATRWEPECIQVGDGIATVTLDTYRPCTKSIEVPSVEETGFNTVVLTANFENVSAFVEECYPNGRCYYEEIVSGDEYAFTAESNVNLNLVLENDQAEESEIKLFYDYSFVDSANELHGSNDPGALDRPNGAFNIMVTFAVMASSLLVFLF